MRPALLALLSMLLTLPLREAWAQGREPIRYAVSTAWSMPYGELRDGVLVQGINQRLGLALAAATHRPLQPVMLPRPRLEAAAQAGEYDLRCHVQPEWTRTPQSYQWSVPLFELTDVLVGRPGIAAPAGLEDLQAGATVATVTGYLYPPMEARFADGRLRRDDGFSEDRSLRKLMLGRNDYAVVNSQDLGWFLKQTPEARLAPWRLPVHRGNYHCAVPLGGRIPAAELLEALQKLRSSGEIERILAQYRQPQWVLVVAATSPIQSLDGDRARELFTGQTRQTADGQAVAQLLLPSGSGRDDFVQRYLGLDLAQWQQQWSRLVFSGRARPPLELSDLAALKNRLLAQPRALGVLDLADVDERLRVLH
ncbi:transporter substrate-binding domain-containing protein [Pelomonas sp. SE-A7]|uniref:substrate-binding periplasmic protein n=1 Tax=Pelomonas sp. SE-A7 TaxID=3054953 RepID=UPI00259D0770|nr:transporter substrate-binding domain-containing protein [Pelomonas sp. SE-A7]MDM4765682.1 transporter substrate-binding domain-containing protein [Pelomonas sp. SE-A7]